MALQTRAAYLLLPRKMSIPRPTNLLDCMGRQPPSGVRSPSNRPKVLLLQHWEGLRGGTARWRRSEIQRCLHSSSTIPMNRAIAFVRQPNTPLIALQVQGRK